MTFMNDYDLQYARSRFTRAATPNRLALALVVDNLRQWADRHSDGWAYWPKPSRAAQKAVAHIESTTHAANAQQEAQDISHTAMLAAVRPIKAFLTRHGATAEERERILRSVEDGL